MKLKFYFLNGKETDLISKNVMLLAERLKNEFGLNVDVKGYMSNRSKSSLQAGGFAWEFWSEHCPVVGGYEPMSKYLVKRNRLEINKTRFGEIEIYVYGINDVGYNHIN